MKEEYGGEHSSIITKAAIIRNDGCSFCYHATFLLCHFQQVENRIHARHVLESKILIVKYHPFLALFHRHVLNVWKKDTGISTSRPSVKRASILPRKAVKIKSLIPTDTPLILHILSSSYHFSIFIETVFSPLNVFVI